MNVSDCIEQGLLVKSGSDAGKAKLSIEMAEHKFQLAETEFHHKIFESAIITAYMSMFHSARALLFRDGCKERSHFAVYVYLNEKYGRFIERKYLNEFNSLRLQRHDLMYGIEKSSEASESEADSVIKTARGFLESIKKILNQKSA